MVARLILTDGLYYLVTENNKRVCQKYQIVFNLLFAFSYNPIKTARKLSSELII